MVPPERHVQRNCCRRSDRIRSDGYDRSNSGARPGDIVAVLGLGGLGHLGVQYAAKMGFRTVAIARGQEKIRGTALAKAG